MLDIFIRKLTPWPRFELELEPIYCLAKFFQAFPKSLHRQGSVLTTTLPGLIR